MVKTNAQVKIPGVALDDRLSMTENEQGVGGVLFMIGGALCESITGGRRGRSEFNLSSWEPEIDEGLGE